MPLPEDSIESQEDLKGLKEKGLYEPLVGGPYTQKEMQGEQMDMQVKMQEKSLEQKENEPPKQAPPAAKPSNETGRPAGTDAPQTTKKVTPIGAKYTKEGKKYKEYNFLLSKVKDSFIAADKLNKRVETSLKRKHKIKELDEQQKAIAFDITKVIVANEEPESQRVCR